MKVLGYSERGLINSLFYELKYSEENLDKLNKLLSLANFPYKENKGDRFNFNISRAKILIEQSFSQFGDADIVLMIENNNKKQIVFIEAKVKTFQRKSWEIFREFNEFDKLRKKSGVVSSNLFIQLFLKVVLAKTLNMEEGITKLRQGINFPKFSKRNPRKIGENGVVVDAVEECETYCDEPFFIALLPEKEVNIEEFYNDNLKNSDPQNYYGWDIKKLGFITWEQVENFCNTNNFENTLSCFEWNEGQIYEKLKI